MKVDITSNKRNYNYQLQCADKGIVGIYGVSGCGKSSLLDAIAGYHQNRQGLIEFNQKELKGIIKCSYMNQHPTLFPHWTIEENLDFAIGYGTQDKSDRDKLLQQLKCEKFLPMYPNQLSGGEKQRIAFVRTLLQIQENSLVLLDEPFSALDPKMRLIAINLLMQYKTTCLILLVTHEISEIYQFADELVYLKEESVSYHDKIDKAMSSNHGSLPIASKLIFSAKELVVYADDVSVSLNKNKESSISYQLDALVVEVYNSSNSPLTSIVKLKHNLTQQFIYAKLMNDSIQKLRLSVGKQVVACFKCSSNS